MGTNFCWIASHRVVNLRLLPATPADENVVVAAHYGKLDIPELDLNADLTKLP